MNVDPVCDNCVGQRRANCESFVEGAVHEAKTGSLTQILLETMTGAQYELHTALENLVTRQGIIKCVLTPDQIENKLNNALAAK